MRLLGPLVIAAAVMAAGCVSAPMRSESSDPRSSPALGSGAVSVTYGSSPSQFGELSEPAGTTTPLPVVVLIHGGYWSDAYDLDLMRPLALDLVARGYAVWNIEYRRLGERGGGYPGTLDDVGLAIDLLGTLADDHSLDLSRVSLVGHSSGGQLALWAADRSKQVVAPSIAIGLGPVVDLANGARAGLGGGAIVELLGGTPDQQPQRYQDATPTTTTTTKLVVVRGGADSVVPAQFTLPADDIGTIDVIDIPGEDHFDLIDPSSASWAAVLDKLPPH